VTAPRTERRARHGNGSRACGTHAQRGVDRLRADAQRRGDLSPCHPARGELGDAAFSLRQFVTGSAAQAEASQLGSRALCPQTRAARLEDAKRFVERVFRVRTLPHATLHYSLDQERARELERHRQSLGMCERL
jgi:hypothetical protein